MPQEKQASDPGDIMREAWLPHGGPRPVAALMVPHKAQERHSFEASPTTVLQERPLDIWKELRIHPGTKKDHGKHVEAGAPAAQEQASPSSGSSKSVPDQALPPAKPIERHPPLSGEAMRQRRRQEKEKAEKKRRAAEGPKSTGVPEIREEPPTGAKGSAHKLFHGWWGKKSLRSSSEASPARPTQESPFRAPHAVPQVVSRAALTGAPQLSKAAPASSNEIQEENEGGAELAAPHAVVKSRKSLEEQGHAKAGPNTQLRAAAEGPQDEQPEPKLRATSTGPRCPSRLLVPDFPPAPEDGRGPSLPSSGTTRSSGPAPAVTPETEGPTPATTPGSALSAEGLVAKYVALEHKTAVQKAKAKAAARAEAKWAGVIQAKDQELHALRTRVLELKDEVRRSPGSKTSEEGGQAVLAQARQEADEVRDRLAEADKRGATLSQQLEATQAQLSSMASEIQQSNAALEAASRECAQLMQRVVHAERTVQETRMERDVGWRTAKAGEAQVAKLTATLAALGHEHGSAKMRLETALQEKDAQIAHAQRERDALAQEVEASGRELEATTEVLGRELMQARGEARDLEVELQGACAQHEAQCRALEEEVGALLRGVEAAMEGSRERAARQAEIEEERQKVADLRARLREVEDALSAKQQAADAVVARLLLQLEEGVGLEGDAQSNEERSNQEHDQASAP